MKILNQADREIEAHVLERASQDPIFRLGVFKDANATLAPFSGAPFPSGMIFIVREEQLGQHLLVSPVWQPIDALLLDELEPALVGGGRTLRPRQGGTGFSDRHSDSRLLSAEFC